MKTITIARFCLLEALRTRYLWLLIGISCALLIASFFLKSVAITESSRIQLGVFAACTRIVCVLMLALHVAGTMVREFNDKGTDLLLALDLTRTGYLLGRFCGYALVSLMTAAVASLFVAMLGPAANLLAWGVSLALELTLVSGVTLFFIVSFVQIAPAVLFMAGFYLLARSISAMQLISHSPLFSSGDSLVALGQKAVDFAALLLPKLDDFAQTRWLLGETPAHVLEHDLAQALVYTTLVISAALFDLHRKEL